MKKLKKLNTLTPRQLSKLKGGEGKTEAQRHQIKMETQNK